MKSTLSYHDYQLVLFQCDGEVTRRRKPKTDAVPHPEREPYRRVMGVLDKACHEYRKNITQNYLSFHAANAPYSPSTNNKATEKLEECLYSPLHFIPYDHADSLSMILVDDVKAMHYLTARDELPVEQASMAFCPTRDSLGCWGGDKLFGDLGELFTKEGGTVVPHRFAEMEIPEVTAAHCLFAI